MSYELLTHMSPRSPRGLENSRLGLFTLRLLSVELLSMNQTITLASIGIGNTFHKATETWNSPQVPGLTRHLSADARQALLFSALKGL